MPTPPSFTREQRIENLKAACAARTMRKQLKDQLRDGRLTVREVLEKGKADKKVGKLTTLEILLTFPWVGITTATRILETCGIPNKRIYGLGHKQVTRFLEATEDL